MATFGERLKQVRNEKNVTLDELAVALGTTKATLSRYENSLREPKNEFTDKCASYFNVSTDYLLGRTDVRGIHKATSILRLSIAEQEALDDDATELINNLAMSLSKNKEYLEEKDYEVLKINIRILLETMTIKNKEKEIKNKSKGKN